jgi:methionyl-tRNA synthetase
MAEGLSSRIKAQMDKLQFSAVLEEIWAFVRRCNKYVEENAPWDLAKKPEEKDRLGTVLYNLAESLRIITIVCAPFMPNAAAEMWTRLGLSDFDSVSFEEAGKWGALDEGTVTAAGPPLFPKVDT